jgi:cytochrome c oxidase subunit III
MTDTQHMSMAAADAEHSHDDHGHFTPQAALENAKFAMWLYIGSEIMIFTAMLVAYLIFRIYNVEAIELAQSHLSITLVSANTFLLLASSWAMVMGLREVQRGNNQGLVRWLSVTVVMGAVFVGLQVVEYVELAHNGVVLTVPNAEEVTGVVESGTLPAWLDEGIEAFAASDVTVRSGTAAAAAFTELTFNEQATTVAQSLGQFGQRFYTPTAFHGAHVIVGVLWGLWIINKAHRKQFTSQRYAAVEVFGLYWHFVDVVWIILFTFIYLI